MKNVISDLCKSTQVPYNANNEVIFAFNLGLWWDKLPDYMLPHIHRGYLHQLPQEWQEKESNWSYVPPPTFHYSFISDTGDSWHQCYRDIRSKGWLRGKVHRKGGELQYLFVFNDNTKPEGYQTAEFHLQITIATCKRVLIETKLEPVEVYQTVCEELTEVEDDESITEGNASRPLSPVSDNFSPPEPIQPGDEQSSFDNEQRSATAFEQAQDDRPGIQLPGDDDKEDDIIPF